jgi:adenylate cyclase
MAETLPAAEALDLIRAFHGRVERAVLDQGGMVDKYIGDGALAAFGAIDPDPAAPAAALACARALADAMAHWSAERQAAGAPGLAIGLGIHTGTVLVGDVGGAQQPQFTVIGDTVNVASRLEGLTRTLGCIIVASDATIDAARAAGGADAVAGFERHGDQSLRGRVAPVGVWVLARPTAEAPSSDGDA